MAVRELNIPWLETAKQLVGTKEIPGSRSNSVIIGWAKDLGGWIKNFYKNDDIPWCGLFVAHCMQANDIRITIENPLSAREWNKFGEKTTPRYGCIMVFSRDGGGHVGFYISEDSTSYHILGGNQSNTVNVTRVSKNRFLGARWPTGYEQLANTKRYVKKFDGELSVNEA